MSTPTHLPSEPDEDPRLPAAMCQCGSVWLATWAWGFFAEGGEHTRHACTRIPPPP